MKLAALFSDHMVLQQGMPLPVWGWSEPGDTITVTFMPGAGSPNAGQVKTATAGSDGKWTLQLDPLRASIVPSRLVAASSIGDLQSSIDNAVVGEVWLCSGQSNMQWFLGDSINAEQELAAADHPDIRLFLVPNVVHLKPPRDVKAAWKVCSTQTVAAFSAVGYFFGRELQRTENVPIGLISNAWGGTRVEAWTGRAAMVADELCRLEVEAYERAVRSQSEAEAKKLFEEYQADPQGWLRRHVAQDPGNRGVANGWASPNFDDSAWPEMELPACWQSRGVPGNGVVWFRRWVDIPADWAGKDLDLHLGACDKHDTTCFNNTQVGATSWETENPWNVCRLYRVPGRLVKAGRNLLASRVYSYRNCGGMTGPKGEMRLVSADQPKAAAVTLPGPWRYAVEHDFGVLTGLAGQPEVLPNQNSPYALHENLLAPLVPYAIRGVIWYQGESNVDGAYRYRSCFPRMIRSWRETWGTPFPFLFVQLANHLAQVPDPLDSAWAELREAQLLALHEPATAMAVAIDIGEAEDIHPKNKQDVGRRLALAAQALVYGRPVEGSGPLYRSHSVDGDSVRLRFDHVGGGLVAAGGGPPKGFAVAGKDRKFVWADGVIDGDAVVVRGPNVQEPVAVRYAWADNPDCNLYNREGLPASPFRTDDWPGFTWPKTGR